MYRMNVTLISYGFSHLNEIHNKWAVNDIGRCIRNRFLNRSSRLGNLNCFLGTISGEGGKV
jgi:hypothetical protein